MLRAVSVLFLLATLTSCTLHSTATHWNGRVGADGKPVQVKSTKNVGVNAAVVIPLLGSTSIDKMVNDLTAEIASENGDRVRLIETDTEVYWYGFPPFTWIITPVVTTVTADYQVQR